MNQVQQVQYGVNAFYFRQILCRTDTDLVYCKDAIFPHPIKTLKLYEDCFLYYRRKKSIILQLLSFPLNMIC